MKNSKILKNGGKILKRNLRNFHLQFGSSIYLQKIKLSIAKIQSFCRLLNMFKQLLLQKFLEIRDFLKKKMRRKCARVSQSPSYLISITTHATASKLNPSSIILSSYQIEKHHIQYQNELTRWHNNNKWHKKVRLRVIKEGRLEHVHEMPSTYIINIFCY